jgi:hypothetical protein
MRLDERGLVVALLIVLAVVLLVLLLPTPLNK